MDTGKYIDQLLELYSKELPQTSETAKAISRGAALSEISQTAEKEGLHYISTAAFLAEEQRLEEAQDADISDVIGARMGEVRKHLPDSCDTAAAIDRKAPWSEISQCAERDGLHEVAALILEAEQEGMND
jgi:hypothetical protein